MKGILLVNTGSPKSVKRQDVAFFIKSMLSDPYVMTVPDWFRPILVKGIIVPLRQFASTKHYEQIWNYSHEDSPLIYYAKSLAEKIEAQTQMTTEVAMRYGEPSIQLALERLKSRNDRLHEVIVLPLFPQYANSSYKTVVDEVGKVFFKRPYPFRLKIVEPYFAHPAYIEALAKTIRPFLVDGFDKIVFSFHSLPLSHVEKGWEKGREFDYVFQTKETVRLLIKELDIDVKKTRQVYHSAIGSKWLKPDLDETIEELVSSGAEKIVVVAPGFAADNLETLYDIHIKTRELFLKNGGQEFMVVPCLNDQDHWAESVVKIIS